MNFGFYLGIGGVVIFKNVGLDKILVEIFLDCVILEIDVLYLVFVFYCGKCNESVYVSLVVDKIVLIK